ncbi:MAG: flagellar export protein FliJ [Planctomycetota bacterium]
MATHQFKLEAVRRVRSTERDELRGRLAEAFQAADKLATQRAQVEEELAGIRSFLGQTASAPRLDVNRMLAAQRYELLLRAQVADLDHKAKLLEEEIDRRRAAVVAAEQRVKTLDLLDERQQAQHDAEQSRREATQTDEAARNAWARGQASPSASRATG